jgi:hypothetical protein
MSTVDKYQDIIDSRDVDSRIEELEAERDALIGTLDEAVAALDNAEGDADTESMEGERLTAKYALDAWDDGEELAALVAFRDEAAGYAPDWQYGCTLIRDSYFKDYAQELAYDIGAMPEGNAWPCNCIDWDQAARELQMDYTAVEYGGVTYWVR